MNPLVDNPIMRLITTLQNTNPQEMAQSILTNNPNAQNFMNQVQKECGQRDPKEFTLELCKSRGINTDQVMQLASMLGLK